MEVIERENLQENALKVGNHLIAELKKLAERRKIIGDVRGVGLFVGIELVRDRIKKTPATAEAKHVVSRMKEKRIIVSSDGPDNNVLKLKPPMVFSIENVNHFVSVLDQVLEEADIDFEEVIRDLIFDYVPRVDFIATCLPIWIPRFAPVIIMYLHCRIDLYRRATRVRD